MNKSRMLSTPYLSFAPSLWLGTRFGNMYVHLM